MGRVDEWRFCPRCASPLAHGDERVECEACGFVGHSNSEPTACAFVVDDEGRLLLVRRAAEPHRGTWDLPGGFLREAEHPLDALVRELREETGLEVEPVEFVGVWTDRYGDADDAPTTLNLYWTARVVGGDARPDDDASELRWFAPSELPGDSEVGFANVLEAMRFWRNRA